MCCVGVVMNDDRPKKRVVFYTAMLSYRIFIITGLAVSRGCITRRILAIDVSCVWLTVWPITVCCITVFATPDTSFSIYEWHPSLRGAIALWFLTTEKFAMSY